MRLFFIHYSDIVHSVGVSLHSSLGLELSLTVGTEVGRSLYMLTLNVSHQISPLVDVFVTNTTTPVFGPTRVHLTHALFLYVGGDSVVLNKN